MMTSALERTSSACGHLRRREVRLHDAPVDLPAPSRRGNREPLSAASADCGVCRAEERRSGPRLTEAVTVLVTTAGVALPRRACWLPCIRLIACLTSPAASTTKPWSSPSRPQGPPLGYLLRYISTSLGGGGLNLTVTQDARELLDLVGVLVVRRHHDGVLALLHGLLDELDAPVVGPPRAARPPRRGR